MKSDRVHIGKIKIRAGQPLTAAQIETLRADLKRSLARDLGNTRPFPLNANTVRRSVGNAIQSSIQAKPGQGGRP
jgi:hypothetical protein